MATFQVYQDKAGHWRWRFRANNGQILADSGEGYINKQDCVNGINIVKTQASTAMIEG